MGEDGLLGRVVIACSIGRGSSVSGTPGEGVYAASGYMASGYQVMAGSQADLITGEIAYQTFDQFAIEDDGVDLFNLNADSAVNFISVTSGLRAQVEALKPYQGAIFPTYGAPSVARKLSTKVTLDLKPVAGSEFHTEFFPSVTPLALPKTIDLEAVG
jgi:hypothetical protein